MGRILLSWRLLHTKELKNNRTKWTNVVRVTKEYQREEWGGEYTNPSRTQTLSNFKLPSMSKGNQHSSIVISSGGGYYPRDRVISGERPSDCEHIQVRRYSDPHCDSWGGKTSTALDLASCSSTGPDHHLLGHALFKQVLDKHGGVFQDVLRVKAIINIDKDKRPWFI